MSSWILVGCEGDVDENDGLPLHHVSQLKQGCTDTSAVYVCPCNNNRAHHNTCSEVWALHPNHKWEVPAYRLQQ